VEFVLVSAFFFFNFMRLNSLFLFLHFRELYHGTNVLNITLTPRTLSVSSLTWFCFDANIRGSDKQDSN